MQCRADVTGRVLHRPAWAESAFGAAVLAASGSAGGGLSEAIGRMVHVRKTFRPATGRAEHYHGLYQRFRHALNERGYL